MSCIQKDLWVKYILIFRLIVRNKLRKDWHERREHKACYARQNHMNTELKDRASIWDLFGKLTKELVIELCITKLDKEQVMWLVAPKSMSQSCSWVFGKMSGLEAENIILSLLIEASRVFFYWIGSMRHPRRQQCYQLLILSNRQ